MSSRDDTAGGHPRPALRGARCVVTGGLGFIGSNVVHRLAAEGASVIVIDALVPEHGGDPRNLDGLPPGADVEVVVADICTSEGGEALRRRRPDLQHRRPGQPPRVDEAADCATSTSTCAATSPSSSRCAPSRRRRAIVLTSTRQVYGRPRYLPVDEDHPTQPVDVNGIDKLACEQLHLLYGRQHGLGVVVLRLTNVYGPRQHLERDGLGFLPGVRPPCPARRGDRPVRRRQPAARLRARRRRRRGAACWPPSIPEADGETLNLGHPDSLTLREIATPDAGGRRVGGRAAVRGVGRRARAHRHRQLPG